MMVAEREYYDAARPWLLQKSCKPLKYTMNEQQRALLLARYDGRTETIDEIMHYFPNVPRWRVKRWACELGLSYQKSPPWTNEELDYLLEHLGARTVKQIAKHLGRSKTAVIVKAKRLHVSRRISDGYTMRGLCEGLGADHHKVEKWVAAGWLKGTRMGTERAKHGTDTWHFTDRAVYELVRDHPAEIDPRRAEWLWLVDILISRGRF